jgi:mutator family transposase
MDVELTEHLGYEHGQPPPGGAGNTHNGSTAKTLVTEHGPVRIDTPRDRNSTFEPKVVRKRQRRFAGFDDETGDDEVDRIVTGARLRLAQLPVAELTFHQPLLRPEAIVLPAMPTTTVEAIRDAIRAAIAESRKIDVGQVPEADVRFIPHVTVAYIHHEGAAHGRFACTGA